MSLRWAFNVSHWKPTSEQWKLVVQCVQKEETERCYKFIYSDDCKASMIGQLLMRKAASESLGLPYNKIQFARTTSGKPYLINPQNECFSFNTSHHGNYCVLAAEKNKDVGIDVMKVEHRGSKPVDEYFLLMQKQFSSHEWEFLTQPGMEIEQLRRFYRLWCLKESYVKNIGTGIAFDLKTVSFSCPTPMLRQSTVTTDTKLYLNREIQSQWNFEESFLDVHHCVAVSLKYNQDEEDIKAPTSKLFQNLTFEELVKNCIPIEKADDQHWLDFSSKKKKVI